MSAGDTSRVATTSRPLGVAARAHRASSVAMDTLVSVEVLSAAPVERVAAAVQRALGWFAVVERACSRFDPASEVRGLFGQVGRPVAVSPLLFEAAQFALALARRTHGAFDPAIGHVLEAKGFDRHYLTGERVHSAVGAGERPSFRDVLLDPERRTLTLRRPLVLDLGAVAKGLAIDLAARELGAFDRFCVEAGGDLFARGTNAEGRPWRVGVQHPRDPDAAAYLLDVSDQAICTSGDYERRAADADEHHLVDPRSGRSPRALASVTVIAPTALAADGLGTAAFVLGPERGRRLLEQEGVGGVFITPTGGVRTTRGLRGARA